jgi:hypothetical protein
VMSSNNIETVRDEYNTPTFHTDSQTHEAQRNGVVIGEHPLWDRTVQTVHDHPFACIGWGFFALTVFAVVVAAVRR